MTNQIFDSKTFVRVSRSFLLDFRTYSDFLTESELADSACTLRQKRAVKKVKQRYWLMYNYLNPSYPYYSSIEKHVFAYLYTLLENFQHEKCNAILDGNQSRILMQEDIFLPYFLLRKGAGQPSSYPSSPFLQQTHRELLEYEQYQKDNQRWLGQALQYTKDSYLLAKFILRYPFVRLIKSIKKDDLLDGLLKKNRKFHSVWDGIDTSSDVLSFYVYRKGVRAAWSRRALIAELTFLTIQLGDELIDQLSIQLGVGRMMNVIHDHTSFFSIGYHQDKNQFYVPTSIEQFQEQGLDMDAFNDKFKITYRELLQTILRILERINQLLPDAIHPQEAGRRIHFCFVHCLSTYYDDLYINDCGADAKYIWKSTKWYYYKKTNAVLIVWLVLRACLFDLDPTKYSAEIKEWGFLLNNLQIYDDLKDMKVDFLFQPNMAHIVAAQHFPDEFRWFEEHQQDLKENIRIDEIVLLGLEMPATVANVMIIARKDAVKNLSAFTLLMANYCWKRNWSQSFMNYYNSNFHYDLLAHPSMLESVSRFSTGKRSVDLFFSCLLKIQSAFDHFENKSFFFDYLFNICMYDSRFKFRFHLTHNLLQNFYILRRSHYLRTGHKEQLLFSMLRPYRKEVRAALEVYAKLPGCNNGVLNLLKQKYK